MVDYLEIDSVQFCRLTALEDKKLREEHEDLLKRIGGMFAGRELNAAESR